MSGRQVVRTTGICDCGCGKDLEVGKTQFCYMCTKGKGLENLLDNINLLNYINWSEFLKNIDCRTYASTLKECAIQFRACSACELKKKCNAPAEDTPITVQADPTSHAVLVTVLGAIHSPVPADDVVVEDVDDNQQDLVDEEDVAAEATAEKEAIAATQNAVEVIQGQVATDDDLGGDVEKDADESVASAMDIILETQDENAVQKVLRGE